MNSDRYTFRLLYDFADRFKWQFYFSLSGLLYLRVSSLQIDPHHDGIILAPAVAVSEGLAVQAHAFSQYGPLSPLLQGVWLAITGPTLLNLRIFTAIQVGLISLLLYKVLAKSNDRSMAKLVTLLWLACSGVWATKFPGALLPWPSLISTLFALAAYLLFLNSRDYTGLKSDLFLISSGLLIGFSGFARIQSWLLIAPFLLSLLLSSSSRLVKASKLLFGSISGLCLMSGYLYYIGALDDYYKQSILFPVTVYPKLGSDNRYNRFETGLYVIEFFVLALLLLTIWKAIKKFKRSHVYLISLSLSISMLTWGFWIQRQESLWIRLRILFGEPFERILVSPLYAAAIGSFMALGYFLVKSRFSVSKLRKEPFVPALFAALSAIQLFPQSDVMHLWWIAPLCLPFCSQAIHAAGSRYGAKFLEATRITFSTFILLGFFFALNFIRGPWVEYELPVLKGTYAKAEKVERVDFYGDILKYAKPQSASFDCGDGLYSVAGGQYLAADQWFVNWGYSNETIRNLGSYRFICDHPLDYAKSEAERLGMQVIDYSEHLLPDYPWSLAILRRG